MISNMAGPVLVKLSGLAEGMGESDLAKKFFENVEKYKGYKFGEPCTFWDAVMDGGVAGRGRAESESLEATQISLIRVERNLSH